MRRGALEAAVWGREGREALQIEQVLARVRDLTGLVATHYKPATVRRQLARRLADTQCPDLATYLDRLVADPDEVVRLRNSLMVSVTRFRRDPAVFDRLSRALQALLAGKAPGEPVRCWVAGCATGEEAYTLAMLLADLLGERVSQHPVRIFATDVDADAIAQARQGQYPADALTELPPHWVAQYFSAGAQGHRLCKSIRDLCVFAPHDLLAQPAFLNLDLLSCRNVLIYFQAEVQAELLTRFHHALRPDGLLLLGQSESVGPGADGFSTEDLPSRLYRRVDGLRAAWSGAPDLPSTTLPGLAPHVPMTASPLEAAFHRVLLQQHAVPSVLVDTQGQVLKFWGRVEPFLSLREGADFSLLRLCHPALVDDIRSLLHLALVQPGESLHSAALPWPGEPGQAGRLLRLSARQLAGGVAGPGPAVVLGFALSEAAPVSAGQEDLAARDEQLAAREQLHAMALALERSQAELQALREELQVSSEELQSSNEELQASNEELSSLNEQLTAKSTELGEVNDVLLNIEASMQTALVVVDAEHRVQRFNPLAVRIFGLLPRDIGRPLGAVPCSLHLPDLHQHMAEVLASGRTHVEQLDQGERHHVLQMAPLRDRREQILGVILTFTDVATLRQAELALARLAAIVTHSEDAIVAKTLDGIITSWNPAAERLFGYTAAEAIGQPMLMVFPEDLVDQEAELLARMAVGEVVQAFDTVRRHKQGHVIHVSVTLSPIRDPQGRVVGVSKIARDIGERVADEAVRSANLSRLARLVDERTQALAEKEQHLQAILEGIPGLVAYWRADLSLQYANHQADAASAYLRSAQNRQALLAHMLVRPADGALPPQVPRLLQGEAVEFDLGPLTLPDWDEPLHFQVCCVPHAVEGRVVGFIGMAFDVTSVKRAQAEAALASRAKSEFLANMSHEIRTPLHAVLGLAQVAQRQHAGASVADTFGQIIHAGQHLLGVLNDVLDFSKIEAGKLQLHPGPFTLDALLATVDELIAGQARAKGLLLSVCRDAALPVGFEGDQTRIAQLLINLLTNAVKFTEAGEVRLDLASDPRGGLHLAVQDTGIGIAPAQLALLFQPFEQGDRGFTRKAGGTGLGLSICKRLTDLMQGTIGVHSTLGHGTRFEVWLPLAPLPATGHAGGLPGSAFASSTAGTPAGAAPEPIGPRLAGLRVLAAEDNPVNQLVLEQILLAEGAEVSLVEHGGQAVQAVVDAQNGLQPLPHVVLCDIEMPVMDGYEAARRIRALCPALPIIGLTAHAFHEARLHGLAAGMDDYITKPYLIDDLVAAVQRVWEQPAGL